MILDNAAAEASGIGPVLLGLTVILVAARLGGALFERFHQSAVLGELVAGVLIGNLHYLGLELGFLSEQPVLDVLAEIGIILLLFEVGIEWTVPEMMRVGWSALRVALVGVVVPAVLGYATAVLLLGHESGYAHLFVGATLCATSVGITARVLQDLGKIQTPEARIILGAAVMDDVLGLMVLAVVSGLILAAAGGQALSPLSVGLIVAKATLFLAAALLIGQWAAPHLIRLGARLPGRTTLLPLSLSFCFLMAWLSHLAGLAPIVGAFTAGLILDTVDLEPIAAKEGHTLTQLLHPLTALLLPIFFLLMGLKVDLRVLAGPGVLVFAGVLTLAAILGKLACAVAVRDPAVDRWVVALGMLPRGEVGLIFAGIGGTLVLEGRPVLSAASYSAVVIMVMATTLVAPWLLRRRFSAAS